MSTYAIGDLQGCVDSFDRLAARLPDADRFIFVGDLVNRGPQSLATLRRVKALVDAGARADDASATTTCTCSRSRPASAGALARDTLQEILDAPDRDELLDWVRTRPLSHREDGYLFVHAGVLPAWTVDKTLALVATKSSGGSRPTTHEAFLREMYGNEPACGATTLTGHDRLRCVVNALTRMRLLAADGRMNLKHHDASARAPAGLVPWFDLPRRATRGTPIVFGHWSTEGLVMRDDVIGIDTGCLWGGCLTALRLEDRAAVPGRLPAVDGAGRLIRPSPSRPSLRSPGRALRAIASRAAPRHRMTVAVFLHLDRPAAP